MRRLKEEGFVADVNKLVKETPKVGIFDSETQSSKSQKGKKSQRRHVKAKWVANRCARELLLALDAVDFYRSQQQMDLFDRDYFSPGRGEEGKIWASMGFAASGTGVISVSRLSAPRPWSLTAAQATDAPGDPEGANVCETVIGETAIGAVARPRQREPSPLPTPPPSSDVQKVRSSLIL